MYAYPANCPEKAMKSLEPVTDFEKSGIEKDQAPLDQTHREPQETKPNDLPPHFEDQEDKESKPESPLESIPPEIQQTIEEDSRLLERASGIIQTYHSLNKHPAFNMKDFKQKVLICLDYCHDKQRFGAYLYKSLLNEWKKTVSPPNSLPKPPRTRPHDVPEWVWRQQESPPESNSADEDEIDPELKAEIEDLLRQLGEIE